MKNKSLEKPKNFKQSLKKLLNFIKPQKFLLAIGIILSVVYVGLTVFCPKLLGDITNELQRALEYKDTINFQLITNIGITLAVLYGSSNLVDFISGIAMSKLATKVGYRFRKAISEKINKIPLSYYDKSSIGDILSRITNDVNTITQTIEQSLASMVSSIFKVLGILIIMFAICWQMTLVALVTVPISFLIMVRTARTP